MNGSEEENFITFQIVVEIPNYPLAKDSQIGTTVAWEELIRDILT